jgi:hypothetical protein
LIKETAAKRDPMCRFVAVRSECDEFGCREHTAFVTGIKSEAVFRVDLKARESSIFGAVSGPRVRSPRQCV